MKKIYTLASCDTCRKLLKEVVVPADTEVINIKEQNISAKDLDKAAKIAGSYEALFSRKAVKYRALGLHEKVLSEKEIRKLILEEYTFLKRPVAIIGDIVTSGHTNVAKETLKEALHG
jgi:arsenate reductase (glutaredoxin)